MPSIKDLTEKLMPFKKMHGHHRNHKYPHLYISEQTGHSVWVVDVSNATPRVIETVQVGTNPGSLAVSRDKKTLCVANTRSFEATIIDVAASPAKVKATVALGAEPRALAMTPDGGRVFVSCGPLGSGTIKAVTLWGSPQVVGSTSVQGTLFGPLAVSPDGKKLYAAGGPASDAGNDCISIFDISGPVPQLLTTVEGQNTGPEFVYLDPEGRYAYASFRSGGINVIDTIRQPPAVTRTIGAGEVNGSALSPNGKRLLMGYAEPSGGQGHYGLYDTVSLSGSSGDFFDNDYAPGPMVYSGDGARVYMASRDQLVIFDMNTFPPSVVAELTLPGPAGGIAN